MEDVKAILGIDKANTADQAPENAVPSESEFVQLNKSIKSRSEEKADYLVDHKWKVPLGREEMEVAEVVERSLHFVNRAKDFVGKAVTPSPHGVLAWSAVCFAIQVKCPE
jgi:hypothetical protein